MRRLLFILPLLTFAAIAAYFLYGLGRDPGNLPSALVGKPVPEFELSTLPGRDGPDGDGGGLSASDLKGNGVALVNFFASWCIPCQAEHPLVTRLSEMEGFEVHAINYKDEPDKALAWLRRLGDPYRRIGVDRDGRAGIEWGIYGVPETFVVDGRGIVRFRHAGPLTPQIMDETLLPLIEDLRK